MEVIEFADPGAFRALADPLLLAKEASNCLIIGVTGTLIDRPETYDEHHLWVVTDRETPVAAAVMTPPHNLLLSDGAPEEAIASLAASLAAQGTKLPGVQGTSPTVEEFVDRWSACADVVPDLEVELGVHALTTVRDLDMVPGLPRRAASQDRDLIVDWLRAFLEEADPKSDRSNIEQAVSTRLDLDPVLGGMWIWDLDGEPMSLSGYGGRTPSGMRIGPVYTPPAARGRGFATALVAEQSAWLLGQGRDFCFLFTDMANPTSNSIYRRIGYRRVASARRYGFKTSPPTE